MAEIRLCPSCGFNLSFVPIGASCPGCSHQRAQPSGMSDAVASLVLGLTSLPAILAFGVPAVALGAAGAWLGGRGRKRLLKSMQKESMIVLTWLGLISGLIGATVGLVVTLALLYSFMSMQLAL